MSTDANPTNSDHLDSSTPKVPEWLKPTISSGLEDIAAKLPPEYKLTLICRHDRLENAQIVLTDDDLYLAKKALEGLPEGIHEHQESDHA